MCNSPTSILLQGKPIYSWIRGRYSGNGPGFEDIIYLEVEVIVQALSIVALHHEYGSHAPAPPSGAGVSLKSLIPL